MVFTLIIMVIILLVLTPVGIVVDKKIEAYLKIKENLKFKFDEEVLYMNKSISRIIGVIMLIVAFVFIMFALNHPEKSFPWNNTITWLLYGVYFLVTVVLLIAPKMKK